ncbi:MAG: fructose PTS transporter subunit IIA [Lactobacillus crispatus]|jgi:fructose-specific phosphotransferase system IIA component|nr:fructose PTS transporter subunit IIA [Lactobacillus crispatus]
MTLSEFIQPSLVFSNLKANDKDDVFNQLAAAFLKEKVIKDKDDFISAVHYRESIDTTGVGNGIAIPHGKSSTVQRSAIAIASLENEIDWDSLDGKPVKYVFLLAISENGDQEHLKVLSEIASKLMDEDVIEALHNSKNKNDIIEIFNK